MSRIIFFVPVVAALALGTAGIGAAYAATAPATDQPATASVINDAAPLPVPVHPHPLHHMNPVTDTSVVPGPAITPDLGELANPADTLDPNPPQALSVQFSASQAAVTCNTQAPVASPQYISFTWNVTGAAHVFFGVDTTDAQSAPMFVDLPHSGTSHGQFPAGYEDYTYACPEASHLYTLTAVDDQGHKISRTVTIVNNGDTSY